MRGDPDDLVVRQGRKSDGSGGVRDEVEERASEGDDTSVSVQSVHDRTHSVLSHTVSDVSTVVATLGGDVVGLEVLGLLPDGEVGASQISRTTNEVGDDVGERLDDGLGVLSRSDGGVAGLVDREVLLPALRQVAGDSSGELGVLGGVLLAVRLEEGVPLGVLLGTSLLDLGVDVPGGLGDGELLLGVEAKLLLDRDDVVGLEGGSVNTVGALDLGAETDGGGQSDEGGLVGLLGALDGGGDGGEVGVTVSDVDVLPPVGLESLLDVLSERDVGVSVDGDVVVLKGVRESLSAQGRKTERGKKSERTS